MDNVCTRCGEPWDITCVHDAKKALQVLERLKAKQQDVPNMEITHEMFAQDEAFDHLGENPFEWEVSGALVKKCPACWDMPNDHPDIQAYRESGRGMIVAELAHMSDGDLDGFVTDLEDFHLVY